MKSTYKLFGLCWDRKKVLQKKLRIQKPPQQVLDFHYDFNLFDSNSYVRKIAISKLLKLNDEKEVAEIMDKLELCDTIFAVINCFPKERNQILQRFTRKRIAQSLEHLKERIPNAKIYVDCLF